MPAAQFYNIDDTSLPARPLHLAIGVFDGVHLGHRAVIDAALRAARRGGGLAGALTFAPHPSAVMRPGNPARLICDLETRARLLAATGIDVVIAQPFTRALAAIEPEDFLPLLHGRLPRLATVCVGDGWRFGSGRRGDLALLAAQAEKLGLAVEGVPGVSRDGAPVSSTRVRAFIEAGEIAKANALLGYAYFSEGVVTPGKGLGRSLGFPTLNLAWQPELRPRLGVYAATVRGVAGANPGEAHAAEHAVKHAVAHAAVVNYGLRPTFEDSSRPRVEAHLLGPCPFGAGDTIRVEWLHFLRPEKKFPSAGGLVEQIASDRAAAGAFLGRPPCA